MRHDRIGGYFTFSLCAFKLVIFEYENLTNEKLIGLNDGIRKEKRERNDRDISVTNSILVIKVGLRLCVGLEFVLFVADVHPFVFHNGLERGALGRIEHEELLEEVLAVGRHVERYSVFAS